jgi:nicotinate-nucleotide adenylyltransferase
MSGRRIGLLGGTFDPIHCGHLDLGRAAESALGLTDVVVLTANVPPHRPQPHASSHHRFAMAVLAITGCDRWRASDLELQRGGASYTSVTLRRFHELGFAPTELFFITGADAFAEIETWKDFPSFLDGTHFVVVSRPGHPVSTLTTRLPALTGRMTRSLDADSRPATSIFLIDADTADVSASAIRRRAATGGSIAGLVPPAVLQHIERHALYAEPGRGPSPGDLPFDRPR